MATRQLVTFVGGCLHLAQRCACDPGDHLRVTPPSNWGSCLELSAGPCPGVASQATDSAGPERQTGMTQHVTKLCQGCETVNRRSAHVSPIKSPKFHEHAVMHVHCHVQGRDTASDDTDCRGKARFRGREHTMCSTTYSSICSFHLQGSAQRQRYSLYQC